VIARSAPIVIALAACACSSAKPAPHAAPGKESPALSDDPELTWSELGPKYWPRHEGKTIRTKGYVFVSLSICGKQRCDEGAPCMDFCNACSEYLSIAEKQIPDEPRSDSWDKLPSLGLAGQDPAEFSCEKPSGSCKRSCPLVVGAKYEIAGRFHDGIVYGVSYRPVTDED
jgi:hypothetical protein